MSRTIFTNANMTAKAFGKPATLIVAVCNFVDFMPAFDGDFAGKPNRFRRFSLIT